LNVQGIAVGGNFTRTVQILPIQSGGITNAVLNSWTRVGASSVTIQGVAGAHNVIMGNLGNGSHRTMNNHTIGSPFSHTSPWYMLVDAFGIRNLHVTPVNAEAMNAGVYQLGAGNFLPWMDCPIRGHPVHDQNSRAVIFVSHDYSAHPTFPVRSIYTVTVPIGSTGIIPPPILQNVFPGYGTSGRWRRYGEVNYFTDWQNLQVEGTMFFVGILQRNPNWFDVMPPQ